jgi:hypothetical protein
MLHLLGLAAESSCTWLSLRNLVPSQQGWRLSKPRVSGSFRPLKGVGMRRKGMFGKEVKGF